MIMFSLYTLVKIFGQSFQNLTPKIEMGTIFWDGTEEILFLPIICSIKNS